jgi:hypothetical protein
MPCCSGMCSMLWPRSQQGHRRVCGITKLEWGLMVTIEVLGEDRVTGAMKTVLWHGEVRHGRCRGGMGA